MTVRDFLKVFKVGDEVRLPWHFKDSYIKITELPKLEDLKPDEHGFVEGFFKGIYYFPGSEPRETRENIHQGDWMLYEKSSIDDAEVLRTAMGRIRRPVGLDNLSNAIDQIGKDSALNVIKTEKPDIVDTAEIPVRNPGTGGTPVLFVDVKRGFNFMENHLWAIYHVTCTDSVKRGVFVCKFLKIAQGVWIRVMAENGEAYLSGFYTTKKIIQDYHPIMKPTNHAAFEIEGDVEMNALMGAL
jgi:hypothetical protein